MNQIAIRDGLTSVLRIWYVLRHLDPSGTGVVSRDSLREFMAEHGITRQQLRTARLHPKSKLFFDITESKCSYSGLESVCKALAAKPGQPVYIPIDSLAKNVRFRAALYASWFSSGRGPVNISRESLSELFGVSDETQRRWEFITGLDVTFNMIEVDDKDAAVAAHVIPPDHRVNATGSPVFDFHGAMAYRTVNTYHGIYARAPRGVTRKVERVVKAEADFYSPVGKTQRRRIFYDEASTPENHQLAPGLCVRESGYMLDTAAGEFNLWSFSTMRPVPRKAIYV